MELGVKLFLIGLVTTTTLALPYGTSWSDSKGSQQTQNLDQIDFSESKGGHDVYSGGGGDTLFDGHVEKGNLEDTGHESGVDIGLGSSDYAPKENLGPEKDIAPEHKVSVDLHNEKPLLNHGSDSDLGLTGTWFEKLSNKWNQFEDNTKEAAEDFGRRFKSTYTSIQEALPKLWQHFKGVLSNFGVMIHRGADYVVQRISVTFEEVKGSELITKLEQRLESGDEMVDEFFQKVGEKVTTWMETHNHPNVDKGFFGKDEFTQQATVPDLFKDPDIHRQLDKMVAGGVITQEEKDLLSQSKDESGLNIFLDEPVGHAGNEGVQDHGAVSTDVGTGIVDTTGHEGYGSNGGTNVNEHTADHEVGTNVYEEGEEGSGFHDGGGNVDSHVTGKETHHTIKKELSNDGLLTDSHHSHPEVEEPSQHPGSSLEPPHKTFSVDETQAIETSYLPPSSSGTEHLTKPVSGSRNEHSILPTGPQIEERPNYDLPTGPQIEERPGYDIPSGPQIEENPEKPNFKNEHHNQPELPTGPQIEEYPSDPDYKPPTGPQIEEYPDNPSYDLPTGPQIEEEPSNKPGNGLPSGPQIEEYPSDPDYKPPTGPQIEEYPRDSLPPPDSSYLPPEIEQPDSYPQQDQSQVDANLWADTYDQKQQQSINFPGYW